MTTFFLGAGGATASAGLATFLGVLGAGFSSSTGFLALATFSGATKERACSRMASSVSVSYSPLQRVLQDEQKARRAGQTAVLASAFSSSCISAVMRAQKVSQGERTFSSPSAGAALAFFVFFAAGALCSSASRSSMRARRAVRAANSAGDTVFLVVAMVVMGARCVWVCVLFLSVVNQLIGPSSSNFFIL